MTDSPAPSHRSPRIDKLNDLPPTPRRLALRRLAAASRRLNHLISDTNADARMLNDAAEELEHVVDLMEKAPNDSAYEGIAEMANAGDMLEVLRRRAESGDPEAWAQFDFSPFIGLASPLAPPMTLAYDGDSIVGTVRFGPAYEGPPGCVHGGYVAAVFDELLGATQSLSGDQGMTANLSVDYVSPTPLDVELNLTGEVVNRDGRKINVSAVMCHGDLVTAKATGLFISFNPDRFKALLRARQDRSSRS